MQRRYAISGGIILGGAVLAFILISMGMSAEVVGVMVGGIYTFTSVELYSAHKEKEKSKATVVAEIKSSRYRHPLLVLVSAVAIIEVVWNLCGFLMGFVIGLTLGPDVIYYTPQYLSAVNIVSVAIMMFLVAPIAIYITHRVHKYALLWIAALIITNQVLLVVQSAAVLQGTVPFATGETLVTSLIMMALLVPGGVIGYSIAKKTQGNFTLSQLFKRLTHADKKALLELVDSLPSVAPRTKH